MEDKIIISYSLDNIDINVGTVPETVNISIVERIGEKGDPGVGIPVGGSIGQVLSKNSTTDYDMVWSSAGAGDMTKSVYDTNDNGIVDKATGDKNGNDITSTYQPISQKNQANGYSGLDSGGKIPIANLPTTLLKYQGVWDASTNTPTLTNPDSTKIGNVYNVSVAGTQFGITFSLGDWLIYNASGVPEKSDNSDDVTSVNGLTGSVSITTTNLVKNSDLDLGEYKLLAKGVNFPSTSPSVINNGDLYYDPNELTIVFKGYDGTTLQIGEEQYVAIVNKTGSQINDGSPCYINNAQGNRPTATIADSSTLSSSSVIGVATQNIANDATGKLTTFGIVHGFNTTGMTDGGSLWLNGTSISQTKPTTGYIVHLGYALNSTTNGSIFVNPSRPLAIDLTSYSNEIAPTVNAVRPLNTLTVKAKQLTGFEFGSDITITYNSVAGTVSLSAVVGKLTAYWQGMPITGLTSTDTTWTSPAHGALNTANRYFLSSTDGINFTWSTAPWTFDHLMIAMLYYNGADWIGVRETHGLMDRYTHEQLHNNTGTTLRTGGDMSGIVLNSTTVANRRPTISDTTLADEDLLSMVSGVSSGAYSHFILTGANSHTISTSQTDIIPLSGNQPYYVDPTSYAQTLFPNNAYGKIFVLAQPTTADATSQSNRLLFIQPQQASTTLATIQAITTSNINLDGLSTLLNEFVYIGEIIVRYTGGNWQITSYAKITGTKTNQATTGGGALTSITTNDSLVGGGTLLSPLGMASMFDRARLVGLQYVEDFALGDSSSLTDKKGFTISVGNSGTYTFTNNKMIVTSGAATNSGYGMVFTGSQGTSCLRPLSYWKDISGLVQVTAVNTTNKVGRVGAGISTYSAPPTDGVYIEFSGGNIYAKTSKTGVETVVSTLVTGYSLNTWYRCVVDTSNPASINFYVYNSTGTLLGSANATANLPTSNIVPFVNLFNTTNATGTLIGEIRLVGVTVAPINL